MTISASTSWRRRFFAGSIGTFIETLERRGIYFKRSSVLSLRLGILASFCRPSPTFTDCSVETVSNDVTKPVMFWASVSVIRPAPTKVETFAAMFPVFSSASILGTKAIKPSSKAFSFFSAYSSKNFTIFF
ncbi:hypothetical protein D3C87_1713720 [compost metagenome]